MNKLLFECHDLLKKSGLPYAVCGGFALDLFINGTFRKHTDFDINIFEEHKKNILDFMLSLGWKIYDHNIETSELMPIDSADDERVLTLKWVWAVKPDCSLVAIEPKGSQDNIFIWKMSSKEQLNCDFIEIIFNERRNRDFICNSKSNILRPLDKAILHNNGIPYLAPELILYFKSSPIYMTWAKTTLDFDNTAHLLDEESRDWLVKSLKATYPDGHEWVERLEKNINTENKVIKK